MKTVESIPNAGRTFDALRSLGYDLNSSVADVVDNAITSKIHAKNIQIVFRRKGAHFICRIIDDGSGMTRKELEEAMRIGTEASYGEQDLGKFGMGMKTASLSHCNILTVISKAKNAEPVCFRWDMDHVKGTKKWSLLRLQNNEIKDILSKEKITISETGTIVLWDDLFLLDSEYNSYDIAKFAENYYYKLLGNLRVHLGMVFHRFIDGSLGGHKSIKIKINDEELKPWDPFCRDEANTIQLNLPDKLSELEILGHQKPILIKGFVLPNKEQFSSEKAWERAKGLLSWNDSQGYYIYRANRIIRFGGWHGTKAKDEHDKLARFSIDIDPKLDKFFRITVNKSKVQFPEVLFNHLKNKVNKVVIREAKKQYNKSENRFAIKNKFRNESVKLNEVSKNLMQESSIKTKTKEDEVAVVNPAGSYVSNKVDEFIKYGTSKDFEVVCDYLRDDHLWKLICNSDEKFKVIINARHSFYKKIYDKGSNKALTSVIDALIFSLAFAELYNRNEKNALLFDTFKTVCSQTLKKLTEEELY